MSDILLKQGHIVSPSTFLSPDNWGWVYNLDTNIISIFLDHDVYFFKYSMEVGVQLVKKQHKYWILRSAIEWRIIQMMNNILSHN